MVRKATKKDIPTIAKLYNDVIDYQSANGNYMSWIKNVYPTHSTAENALMLDTLYVFDLNGFVFGSVILDCIQPQEYMNINWITSDNNALVIHTLCVDPEHMGMGIASEMLTFAKSLAKSLGCSSIRLATNSKNMGAIHLYEKNGFSIVEYNAALLDGKIECPRQCFMEHIII